MLVLAASSGSAVRYVRWITTNFVVTTDRLIYRHGVLAKHGIEIPLDRVNTVFFRQSIFERIVGVGRPRHRVGRRDGPPGVHQRAQPVRRAERDLPADRGQREPQVRPGRPVRGGGQRPRPTTTTSSIPAQIRELDELRKQGVLTDDEFAAKKQQLLDRM